MSNTIWTRSSHTNLTMLLFVYLNLSMSLSSDLYSIDSEQIVKSDCLNSNVYMLADREKIGEKRGQCLDTAISGMSSTWHWILFDIVHIDTLLPFATHSAVLCCVFCFKHPNDGFVERKMGKERETRIQPIEDVMIIKWCEKAISIQGN